MKKIFLSLLLCLTVTAVFSQNSDQKYLSENEAIDRYTKELNSMPFLVFPESRGKPIKWQDSLRLSWLKNNYNNRPFVLQAQPGEYYVFQVGVWAIHQNLKNLKINFSALQSTKGGVIATKELTCFNAGGINYLGKPFKKQINIPSGSVQPLWIGINVPKTAKGRYEGTITIAANDKSSRLHIQLNVSGKALPNHGFNEGKRLARLAWLNSTAGINDSITKGYITIKRTGNIISILGRSMKIADNGLPEKITTYFTPSNQSISSNGEPIINKPFHFIIEEADGTILHLQPGKLKFTSQSPSGISWEVNNTSTACDVICDGKLEYDGFADYHLTVRAKKSLQIKDIRLQVAMDKDKATYMMGLNKAGGFRPENWNWKWDTAKNQDDVWLGAVNGGLRIKWKAENYVLPLVNVYYAFGKLHLPSSWGNEGKGGVDIFEKGNEVLVTAYSGSRKMKVGEDQHYDFEMLITPFKTIQKSVQYGARYYQADNNISTGFIHKADSLGANIITVHQGNDIYPFINYPFSDVNVNALQKFITKAHKDNKRVKVYYTTRELTVNLPELWPFISLNGEIIYPGPGGNAKTVTNPNGPDLWLLKNLKGRKYIPAWVAHFTKGKYKGMQDLSVITRPDSRLNNFYVAGLNWMVQHLNIDGIYIDDCSMDRTTIRRVRKILDNNCKDANIDMHSWNHFNKYAGFASSLNLYMDLFPYIDQLWIGEGRNYDTPPDYWLVEISGIPFGLPSQMLQGGGNPWRGMVYGMTNRAGWTGAPPDPIWKFWDQYDIQDKTMTGYWDPDNPVSIDNDSIKVTVYRGAKESILAIGNFGSTDQICSLNVNFKKLGYDKSQCIIFMPAIERYQSEKKLGSLKQLKVPAKKGFLIIVKSN